MLLRGSETVQALTKFEFQNHFIIFLYKWPGVVCGECYSSGLVGLEGSNVWKKNVQAIRVMRL